MREIKFRGKRFVGGVWEIGCYLQREGNYGETLHFIYDGEHEHLVHPETVGQYTGLKDEEGTEIYEGDIAVGEHATYSISWDIGQGQYKAKIITTKTVLAKNCSFPLWQYVEGDGKCRFKVIGNIFTHQHLLKGEEA